MLLLCKNESFIHTFLEEIHILCRGALLLLCCSPSSVKVIVVVPQVVIVAPQVVEMHKAVLPPSLLAVPAGLPLSVARPSSWWRRCGLWSEDDFSNHSGIHRGPDAMPVFHGETGACVVTAN